MQPSGADILGLAVYSLGYLGDFFDRFGRKLEYYSFGLKQRLVLFHQRIFRFG